MTVNFSFEPVDEADNTGPFDQFVIEKMMDLGSYFTRLDSVLSLSCAQFFIIFY